MSFLSGKKVLVAGGTGFMGSFLVEKLVDQGAHVRVVSRSDHGLRNLMSYKGRFEFIKADLHSIDVCKSAVKDMQMVFNLAAKVGGVGYNINHHAVMFSENSILNYNLIEASRQANVERYLCTSSTCVYPGNCSIPFPEDEGFDGEPELSNLGYGWAKRMAELQARLYANEYDMKVSIVRPNNSYGPRDDFNPETSHVIPALIRKVFEAKDSITVWGSGKQTRAFVYVEDVVEAMMETLTKYPVADPLNVSTDEEVTIEHLIRTIMATAGKDLELVFDTSKPEGMRRKNASSTKIQEKVGWKPRVTLKEGLRRTVEWYKSNAMQISSMN